VSGPANKPTIVNDLADYPRVFGGLPRNRFWSYAVCDFFLTGGGQAIVVLLTQGDRVQGRHQHAPLAGVQPGCLVVGAAGLDHCGE
jgi:hypothetical protein